MSEISKIKTTALLRLEDVDKKYSKNAVLDKVSFSVQKGSFLGLIGPNGAGKTTLLKIIMGIIKPTQGNVFIKEKNIVSRDLNLRHFFGYASQNNSFYDQLSVIENLHYFGRLYWLTSEEIRRRSKDILPLVGLLGHENTQAKNLSNGMQRKLDIACSIMHNPEILILDEPLAGLDPISANHLTDIFKHLHKIGTTIVMASQLIDVVEELCTDVVVISKGKILETKSPSKLKSIYSNKELLSIQTKSKDYSKIIEQIKLSNKKIKNIVIKNGLLIIELPDDNYLYVILSIIKKLDEKIIRLTLGEEDLYDTFENIIQGKKFKKIAELDLLKDSIKKQLNSYFEKMRLVLKEKEFSESEINTLFDGVKK